MNSTVAIDAMTLGVPALVVLLPNNLSPFVEAGANAAYRKARRAHLDHGGPSVCQSCDLPKKDSPLWITKLW